MSLDRLQIQGTCLKILSPNEYWEYLNFNEELREIFERGINIGYEMGYNAWAGMLDEGDTWPSSKEEWDWEVNRRIHSGPGLLNLEHLPGFEGDYCHPQLVNYNRHYQPEQWNEMNEALVRGTGGNKRKRKIYVDYDQLFLNISLI